MKYNYFMQWSVELSGKSRTFYGSLNIQPISVPFCEWPTIKNSLSRGRVREGTEIKIRCLAGFSVIGSTLVTCQSDGKYSSIPECREIGENDN